jgi:hypothetical protein
MSCSGNWRFSGVRMDIIRLLHGLVSDMTKDDLDRILSSGPVKPVMRVIVEGHEVFIADGYIAPSYLPFLERFNVTATANDYPLGCFATIWFCPKKGLSPVGVVVCDMLHDPEHSDDARETMRSKTAIKFARDELKKQRRLH